MDDKKIVQVEPANEPEKTEKPPKPYTLRKLDGDDIWPVFAIIGETLPEDLTPVFVGIVNGEKTIDEVGADVVMRLVKAIIKNIGTCKEEVYTFLSGVSGLSKDEINALGLFAVPKMIYEIISTETDFFGESVKSS